jgi:phosphohistidine phosphatase
MRLYLVQHGEAVPEDVDPTRPLSAGGRSDVERVAAFLGRGGIRAMEVWHSGKRRAAQTAAILGAALAPDRPPAARAGLNPNDPTEDAARELPTREQDVMLVGHLPFLGKLASRLVAGRDDAGVVAFRPGTVLCLERTDREGWTVVWMAVPEWFRST